MLRDEVERVAINIDHDWETAFIPWLEDKERKKVGVEDGVFVATVDSTLRTLQPQDEERFVRDCSQHKITSVSTLKLREFVQKGLFSHAATDNEEVKEDFKEQMSHLQVFKTDTCCTSLLKQDGSSLDDVVSHIHSVLLKIKKTAKCDVGLGSTKSMVIMEETGLKVQKLFHTYSQNTEGFTWEKRQKSPPNECPEMECGYYSSDGAQKEEKINKNECPKKRAKMRRKSIASDSGPSGSIHYGYGFESPDDCLKVTSNLNLCRIFNILWLLPFHYPGLHSTYLYFGSTHSFFAVHVEDALTWSLNYLYLGHPKLWFVIPPWATELLEFHLHKSCIRLDSTACNNILGHKSVLPTACWLKEREIPFKVVVQCPGDLVVLYPSSAHFGFNLGPNISQAVNVATISWIPWGINAKKCPCIFSQVHLDVSSLVAAFRRDLLSIFLRGGIVVTPEMLRGMQLVRNLVAKSSHVVQGNDPKPNGEHELPPYKCPAATCSRTFPPVETVKQDMMKHVKSSHKPILESAGLLKTIHHLFKE